MQWSQMTTLICLVLLAMASSGIPPWPRGRFESCKRVDLNCTEHLAADNKTCIISVEWASSLTSRDCMACHWDGDVIVQKNAYIQAGEILINATGDVTLNARSRIRQAKHVGIYGRSVWLKQDVRIMGQVLQAKRNTGVKVDVGGPQCTGRISMEDSVQIIGKAVKLNCSQGIVDLSCSQCTLKTEPPIWFGLYKCEAQHAISHAKREGVILEGIHVIVPSRNVSIMTAVILVHAYNNATFAADVNKPKRMFINLDNREDEEQEPCHFLMAGGQLSLGSRNGKWEAYRFVAVADRVEVEKTHSIETKFTGRGRCNAPKADNDDLCKADLISWTTLNIAAQLNMISMTLFDQHPYELQHYLYFDFVIVARTEIVIGAASDLWATSFMLCSGRRVLIERNSRVSSDGRGCSPGDGQFSGECLDVRFDSDTCGAAGASHFGSGGAGAEFRLGELRRCCDRGLNTNRDLDLWKYLPTEGASGGGCGTEEQGPAMCLGKNNPRKASFGGGLIWLSTVKLALEGNVKVSSGGHPGNHITYEATSKEWRTRKEMRYMTSGGGAGGQILLFISELADMECDKVIVASRPLLSAKGGDGTCNTMSHSVSGGGGGGFIGLKWRSDSPRLEPCSLDISVAGGNLDDASCVRLFPTNVSGLGEVRGMEGLATSLAPCESGHGGPFCVRCAEGKWGSGHDKHCNDCTNKRGQSIYTNTTWPDENCPYRCLDGLPDVSINPACTCSAGHYGETSCLPCGVGQWSRDGEQTCTNCSNKPGWSEYLEEAWENESCPYTCTDGVPDIDINPDCLALNAYVISQAGGATFLFQCFLILLLMAFMLIFYAAKRKHKRDKRAKQMDLAKKHAGDVSTSLTAKWQFTHEKLPHHICRVYLCGRNMADYPWCLSEHPPASLQHLLLADRWHQFVSRLNKAGKAKRVDQVFTILITAMFWPAAQLMGLSIRKRRAKSIGKLVSQSSTGEGGKLSVWKESSDARSRGPLKFAMHFSCDSGATLGYIDFFDFSFNLYDWKPVDLRMEARLLVAHGLGSYNEPMALDVADPLVEQVAQAGFGAPALYSVVFAFNRIARRVPSAELDADSRKRPTVELLRATVQMCAEACGLTGVAHVVLLQQVRPNKKPKPHEMPVQALGSFSDLVSQLKDEGQGAPVSNSQPDVDLKLCLALMDSRTLARLPGDKDLPTTPLMSPMPQAHVSEHQCCYLSQPNDQMPGGGLSFKRLAGRMSSLLSCYWVHSVPVSLPNLVLFSYVVLGILDAMGNLVLGWLLSHMSQQAFKIWLSVFPLTPILSIVVAIASIIRQTARMARFYAAIVGFSVVNTVASTLVLDDLFGPIFFLCMLKFALYCITLLRIRDIEVQNDEEVSFTESNTARSFVDGILLPDRRSPERDSINQSYLIPKWLQQKRLMDSSPSGEMELWDFDGLFNEADDDADRRGMTRSMKSTKPRSELLSHGRAPLQSSAAPF